ncbi:methyl-accepting chemotaxis protein [Emcibacter sp.]|uniref:methyl-accepting chemotaxis protein n=1 Tax=Emcibacter sp. TaxID=1979954 RepID=UPI002AA8CB60|nr:methyl-accepting chemotaxis protein [Emcibacter sp.]
MTELTNLQQRSSAVLNLLTAMPVGRKILSIVTIGIVALCGFFAISQSGRLSAELSDQSHADSTVITQLIASQLPLAIRFNKPENIQRVYMPLTEEENTTLASFAAVNSNGELIDEYNAKDLMSYTLKDILKGKILELAQGDTSISETTDHTVIAAPVFDSKGSKTGTIAIAWSNHLINDAISRSQVSQFIYSVLAVIIMAGTLMVLISKVLTRPLVRLTSSMGELASGNNDVEIEGLRRRDDIGDMTRAVQVFKDNAIQMVRMQEDSRRRQQEEEEQARRLEQEKRERAEEAARQEADAKEQAARERTEMLRKLADSFEARVMSVLGNVTRSVAKMNETAKNLSRASTDTSSEAGMAANASRQAGENVQTVAGAAEEMAASIAEVSRQVNQAATISREAVNEARQAGEQVQELSDATIKIDQVVTLINDIAEQTNLLALNATIEAARAGDAGRGFAVVANEVKTLANQTAQATSDIAAQVANVQNATQSAVTSVNHIAGTINNISDISASIANAVHEQTAATQEISRNSLAAANGTQEVGQNVTNVSNVAQETNQIADQILVASEDLEKQATGLGTEVADFLREIRSN